MAAKAAGSGPRVTQLDGLRAVAVVAVMVQHSGWPIGGGLFGVDVFFVLSGFLITGVLLGERRRHGRISLRRFYLRRWLRLFPALAVMIVVLTPLGPQLSSERTWESWGVAAVSSLTYTSDIVLLVAGDYTLGALSTTWSLAVEEQFYLLWPLLLLGLLALGLRTRWLVAVVAASSLALMAQFWVAYPPDVWLGPYFRPDARFGELLVGCALAIALARAPHPLPRWADRALSVGAVAGVAGIAVAIEWYLGAVDGSGSTVAPTPLIAVSAGLIIARLVTSDRALLSRALRLAPLPAIGLISYGLYLWHAPVFWIIKADPFGLPGGEQPIQWSLTFAAAITSYLVVERPFLRRKDRLRDTPVAGLDPEPGPAPAPAPPAPATA